MPELSFSLLGAPQILCDTAPVSVDTRKAIALLAYLAITHQPQARDTLAALLWPEYDQAHARGTLRRTLSALQKAIGDGYLTVDREMIGLRHDAGIRLDVDDFHACISACQAHEHPATDPCESCAEQLATAARLYRDAFMAGFSLRDAPGFDDWQTLQRDGLQRELATVLSHLTRGYIAQRRYDLGIGATQRWLSLDRLHEPAHRYLMRLYAWSGQRAAALRQYRACVQALDQELGVGPLEATTRLYEAIQEDRLPPPPTRGTRNSGAPARTPSRATSPTRTAYPLVGRQTEWEALLDAYDAITTTGQVIGLSGEAGIGKTRLAEEFTHSVGDKGASVIAVRCYDGESGLAYAPLVAAFRAALVDPGSVRRLAALPERWLSEAARLVPEIEAAQPGLPAAPPLDNPGAQAHFFEGLRQTLLATCQGAQPGVLLIDDIQWADSASLEALTYLTRRLRDQPVCVLLTWRGSQVPEQPALRQLLAEAERAGVATVIALGRLSEESVRELLKASPEAPSAAKAVKRFYRETEGVPLFAIEYLRALASGVITTEQEDWLVPGGIRSLLRSRLDALDGASAQALTAAAIIGRWFDIELLREVSGRGEEEIVEAIDALLTRGLIRELSGAHGAIPTYDFSHEKIRTLVEEDLSMARRRLLHRRAAEALLANLRREPHSSELLGQIAQHYALAGSQVEAAAYYLQAGERARALHANVEALAHLHAALALGHPEAARLHEAIGGLQTVLGDYTGALQSYELAAALAPSDATARLEHQLGRVYARRGDWEQAASHFEAGIQESADPAERAHLLADWSLVTQRQGKLEAAWKLASQAEELAAGADDEHALAQSHNILGVLASRRGDTAGAVSHLERSLDLAEHTGDLNARAAALNNLSLAQAALGDTESALAHAEAALALCAEVGDRHHEAALHNNIADLLHAMGRPDAAMTHLKEAVRIYAEIGVEAGAVRLEIWKLAEW